MMWRGEGSAEEIPGQLLAPLELFELARGEKNLLVSLLDLEIDIRLTRGMASQRRRARMGREGRNGETCLWKSRFIRINCASGIDLFSKLSGEERERMDERGGEGERMREKERERERE
jgi:hypothetical protein